jgi:hypothetical protein
MNKFTFSNRVFDASAEPNRRLDENGRLIVKKSLITKAEVSPYFGAEIKDYQALGLEADKRYNVLRPVEELKKCISDFEMLPLLSRHIMDYSDEPQKEDRTGAVGKAEIDGDAVYAPLSVWDKDEIQNIQSETKRELSLGYSCDFVKRSGKYKGTPYDLVMENIKPNHLALVENARVKGAKVFNSKGKVEDNDWDESEHPKDKDNGQFVEKGGGENEAPESKTTESKAAESKAAKKDTKSEAAGKDIKTEKKEIGEFIDLEPKNNNKAKYEISKDDREKAEEAVQWFIDNTAKYTKENPLESSVGDKLHFEPNKKALERLGDVKKAYIENALHFITQKKGDNLELRHLARNKLEALKKIIEAAEFPDKRCKADNGDLVYFKTIEDNKQKDLTLILHFDESSKLNKLDAYRVASGMPGLGEKGVEKVVKNKNSVLKVPSANIQAVHQGKSAEANPDHKNSIQKGKEKVNPQNKKGTLDSSKGEREMKKRLMLLKAFGVFDNDIEQIERLEKETEGKTADEGNEKLKQVLIEKLGADKAEEILLALSAIADKEPAEPPAPAKEEPPAPAAPNKGVLFDWQIDWKGRGYDTGVFIAPIKINGKRYIEEVLVERRTGRQGLYVHEVEIKKKLEDFIKTSTEGGHLPTSKLIISERIAKIKQKTEIKDINPQNKDKADELGGPDFKSGVGTSAKVKNVALKAPSANSQPVHQGKSAEANPDHKDNIQTDKKKVNPLLNLIT